MCRSNCPGVGKSMNNMKVAAAIVGLFLLSSTGALSQTSRGTITGVVTDPTQATVSGANVEITQKETNVVRQTTTNQNGFYRFDAVDPGTYDVAVKATGFKTYASR